MCSHDFHETGENLPCEPCGKGADGNWKVWKKVRACVKCGEKVAGETPEEAVARKAAKRNKTPSPPPKSPWIVDGIADPIPDPDSVLPRDKHWTPATHWSFHTRHAAKEVYSQALESLASADLPGPAVAEGSGLIWVGGDGPGGELGLQSCMAIRMARALGYAGAIEWWYDSRTERIEPELVSDCNVEIRDLQTVKPQTRLGGWPNKSVALMHSRFRYCLRFDADCYPIVNPTPLLDLLQSTPFAYWEENSFVNWKRVWPRGAQGVPGVQGGQILADRVAAWRLVIAAAWIDKHREFYYADKTHLLHKWQIYGDQVGLQVSLAAMRSVGKPLDFRVLGTPRFVQSVHEYRHNGQVAIVHRVRDKMHSKGWTPKPGVAGEGEAHLALETCMYRKRNSKDVFSHIYEENKWGQGSGPGSDPSIASPWIQAVNRQIHELGGRTVSVTDLGCGDGRLAVHYQTQSYQGVDCVPVADWPAMLHRRVLDFWKRRQEIPKADLWLIKDVLHHWPLEMVRDWLSWAVAFAPCKRLLLCQDSEQLQGDILLGHLRGLDPRLEPLVSFDLELLGKYGKPEKVILLCNRSK